MHFAGMFTRLSKQTIYTNLFAMSQISAYSVVSYYSCECKLGGEFSVC